jgi:hypothetical protein
MNSNFLASRIVNIEHHYRDIALYKDFGSYRFVSVSWKCGHGSTPYGGEPISSGLLCQGYNRQRMCVIVLSLMERKGDPLTKIAVQFDDIAK